MILLHPLVDFILIFMPDLLVEPLELEAGVRRAVDLPGEPVVLQRQRLEHREVRLPPERQAEDGRLGVAVGPPDVAQDLQGLPGCVSQVGPMANDKD